MKKLIFASTSSGNGKTSITSGIMRALKKEGYNVIPFKIGPDYIDTAFHKMATGNSSTNLDEFLLPKEKIREIFYTNSKKGDISIVEGVMGLYDGYQSEFDYCSTASMAKIIDAKVVLIINAKAMAGSIAALVKGFVEFDTKVQFAGFILNNVSSVNHYNILKDAIEKFTTIPVLGYLPKLKDIDFPSRHLGLITPSEETDKKMEIIAEKLKVTVDLNKLIEISEKVENFQLYKNKDKVLDENIKLCIAYDEAFNFYYKDSIEEFTKLGVEIVKVDTLRDSKLPKCHGLYIGGGYPELYANEISKNKSLLKDIKICSQENMPIYAECGGLMYLGKYLKDSNDDLFEMVGIFDGISEMTEGLKRFGYCKAKAKKNNYLIDKDYILRGHQFHHSIFNTNEETLFTFYKELYDKTTKEFSGGYLKNNTLASYLHIHFSGNPLLVKNFIKAMENYKNSRR